jgi:hypothetical protein
MGYANIQKKHSEIVGKRYTGLSPNSC